MWRELQVLARVTFESNRQLCWRVPVNLLLLDRIHVVTYFSKWRPLLLQLRCFATGASRVRMYRRNCL